jgi:hypothetical protein
MKTEHANIQALQAMADSNSRIELGDKLLKISTVSEILDQSMTKTWDDIRKGLLPPPIYDRNGMARIIDRELYGKMTARYSNPPSDRAQRARVKRAA